MIERFDTETFQILEELGWLEKPIYAWRDLGLGDPEWAMLTLDKFFDNLSDKGPKCKLNAEDEKSQPVRFYEGEEHYPLTVLEEVPLLLPDYGLYDREISVPLLLTARPKQNLPYNKKRQLIRQPHEYRGDTLPSDFPKEAIPHVLGFYIGDDKKRVLYYPIRDSVLRVGDEGESDLEKSTKEMFSVVEEGLNECLASKARSIWLKPKKGLAKIGTSNTIIRDQIRYISDMLYTRSLVEKSKSPEIDSSTRQEKIRSYLRSRTLHWRGLRLVHPSAIQLQEQDSVCYFPLNNIEYEEKRSPFHHQKSDIYKTIPVAVTNRAHPQSKRPALVVPGIFNGYYHGNSPQLSLLRFTNASAARSIAERLSQYFGEQVHIAMLKQRPGRSYIRYYPKLE